MPDNYRQVLRTHVGYFRTPHPITSTYPQRLREQLNAALETMEERMSTFMQAGSGWTLEENNALVLEMVEYNPIGGTSYIQLPKDVYDTKSIVNVKNDDQACFKWSILAALHPADHHAERITNYQPFEEELNFNGIDFPVTVDQISKFEKLNPDISVTVLGIDEPEKKRKRSIRFIPSESSRATTWKSRGAALLVTRRKLPLWLGEKSQQTAIPHQDTCQPDLFLRVVLSGLHSP